MLTTLNRFQHCGTLDLCQHTQNAHSSHKKDFITLFNLILQFHYFPFFSRAHFFKIPFIQHFNAHILSLHDCKQFLQLMIFAEI